MSALILCSVALQRTSFNNIIILDIGSSQHLITQGTALTNKVKDSAAVKLSNCCTMREMAKGYYVPIHVDTDKGNVVNIYL
ncbi:hypothetical protein K437DRAFT_260429 [Tilletiaria anomala UBC 951]|uniref:Uncharacterized protein n=1 Tax=Tilletiaria anomala (strain ATCC 24038 / CBS 436.72 / UBC 951) TaxID=1037660 RepID=A0A066V878_TILAU|nr:uncharacterized protein K437DRAFT_260429 [Tilletiaria anomala UBC 951]KDN34810.1 hypothetical protein K437DRAFT_260429 [Tilletiaria anomala UBC 951]